MEWAEWLNRGASEPECQTVCQGDTAAAEAVQDPISTVSVQDDSLLVEELTAQSLLERVAFVKHAIILVLVHLHRTTRTPLPRPSNGDPGVAAAAEDLAAGDSGDDTG